MKRSKERLVPRVADMAQRGPLAVLDFLICWIAIIGLCALTVALVYQVVARYVFDSPTIWSEELAISLFVWVSMLAVPLGFRRGEHLAIDVFSKRLAPRAVRLLATAVSLLSGTALALIGYYALMILPSAGRQMLPGITDGLGIPAKVSWVYAAVPIGCAISLVFIAERLWAVWTGRVLVLNADADIQAVEQLENDLSLPDDLLPADAGVSRENARSAWRADDVSTTSYLGGAPSRTDDESKGA